MQQLALFDVEQLSIKRWNLAFEVLDTYEDYCVGMLQIPSGKFIVKYSTDEKKITNFEVVDYSGYLYVTVSLIKNLENLLQIILFKN